MKRIEDRFPEVGLSEIDHAARLAAMLSKVVEGNRVYQSTFTDAKLKIIANTLNAAIELHDSTVEEVRLLDGNLQVVASAYIHRSIGSPGVDDGSGWVQDVIIEFENGTMTAIWENFLPTSFTATFG